MFVSTHPFAATDRKPLEVLENGRCEVTLNPFGRKIKPEEQCDLLEGIEGLVAGTEIIDERVLEKADSLRVISRVGVGLDGIDFDVARERGIIVTYTPHAPAMAVAELAVGLILDMARMITWADRDLRKGIWSKYMGTLLRGRTVGIIGVGRIGTRVAHLLKGFGCRVLGCDLRPNITLTDVAGLQWVSLRSVLRKSDFLTLHVPLTDQTYHMINAETLAQMKPTACLVNTSRGPILDEDALNDALTRGVISAAAIDVYHQEPYKGPLINQSRALLTSHMGAATTQSRFLMEYEAAKDCLRVLQGKKPKSPVLMIPSA